MPLIGKAIQILFAGFGFFVGYFWVVLRWAEGGGEAAKALLQVALWAGGGVSLLYAALLAALFWSGIPVPRARGLQMVFSPASFSLSFVVGAMGIHGALRILG